MPWPTCNAAVWKRRERSWSDSSHRSTATTAREAQDHDAPIADDDGLTSMAKLWRDSITSLASAVNGARSPHIDVAAVASSAPIALSLDAESLSATTEVWIHNPTAEALDKLRVHCGAPRSHDGSTLDALSFIADPDSFDLPARSSRGVQIAVCAPDAAPGVYRALLLVEGLADQWLPIEIRVP